MTPDVRDRIERQSEGLLRDIRKFIDKRERLCVVKAPPGSGKTHTLLHGVDHALKSGARVAVGTQTNAQANDVVRRLRQDYRKHIAWRFAANGTSAPAELASDPKVRWVTNKSDIPPGECVVVATTAKWSMIDLKDPYDFLFVDEAWQMSWADFMLLSQVSERFLLIGDPGQIPPVVTISVDRWETSPRAPHRPAPDVIVADPPAELRSLELPTCRRLPFDSVDLVRPFYDFEFDAWAQDGERAVRFSKGRRRSSRVDPALELLESGSAAICALPTPPDGPALEDDADVAAAAAELAVRALARECKIRDQDGKRARALTPADIGIAATHRVMNSAILRSLPAKLRDQETGVRVDTPERWQGLERALIIAVHPLSGVMVPSSFDLDTGRLCVMSSRHRSGLILLTRDHVPATLGTQVPAADQAVGRPDVNGRGHWQHTTFWDRLEAEGRVAVA